MERKQEISLEKDGAMTKEERQQYVYAFVYERAMLAECGEANAESSILDSPSYKAAMRDVEQGRITTYKSADDMFNDLMNEE